MREGKKASNLPIIRRRECGIQFAENRAWHANALFALKQKRHFVGEQLAFFVTLGDHSASLVGDCDAHSSVVAVCKRRCERRRRSRWLARGRGGGADGRRRRVGACTQRAQCTRLLNRQAWNCADDNRQRNDDCIVGLQLKNVADVDYAAAREARRERRQNERLLLESQLAVCRHLAALFALNESRCRFYALGAGESFCSESDVSNIFMFVYLRASARFKQYL